MFVLLGAASLFCTGGASAQSSPTPPVVGEVAVNSSSLVEEAPTGTNGEPDWIQNRRFSNTRIYVQQDPWQIGYEEWWRTRFLDGGHVTQRLQNEIELGLPNRMQLDLYENILHDNTVSGGWQQEEVAVELRYAFANWNVIPGNPTLYVEYSFAHNGSDAIEPKLLLGGDFGNGWHWGFNAICEQDLWGDKNLERAFAGGLSRTIIDEKLSLGIEGNWSTNTGEKSQMILGPSAQWRPTRSSHLDVVAMPGLTSASPHAECWMIFGFDFGDGKAKSQGYQPTSLGGQ